MFRTIRFALAPLLACLIIVPAASGQISTWTGLSSSDWNTTGNWSPFGVPNSTNVDVEFTGAALGTVNISSSVSIASLSFSNPTGNYTLTSSTGQTLNIGGAFLNVGSGVTGTETINLANVATGSLLNSGLSIFNNSTTAPTSLVIGPNTVIGAGGNEFVVQGPGNTLISGSFATAANQVVGLHNYGPGTLTISGNGSNLAGGLNLNGGALVLDYSSNTSPKFGSGALSLDAGQLILVANSGTAVTQTFSAGTNFSNSYAGHVDIAAVGVGTMTLAAGAISRFTGGTTDLRISNSGSLIANITTSTTTTNGLLGAGSAYATVNSGSTWATVSGVSISGLTAYGTNTYTANTNVDVTASSSQSNVTVNSLRFNSGNLTLTLSGTNTLQSGGILVTPSATGGTITGGTLTAPGGGELIVHQYANTLVTDPTLTVNSALVSTVGLTKTGNNILTLGGNNTGLTGKININRGGLAVTNPAAVNSAFWIHFNDGRIGSGVQSFTVDLGNNTNGTITPPIYVSSQATGTTSGGTVFSTGSSLNARVTLSQVIDDSYPIFGSSIQFTGDASNTSGFNLTAANSFAGSVTLSHGFLGVPSDGALGSNADGLVLDLGVGSATGGGLEFLSSFTLQHSITINSTSRVITDAGCVVNDAALVTSAGSGTGFQFVKAGPGTLVLASKTTGLLGGLTLSGGTLVLDYSANTNSKLGGGILTLNGGVLSLTSNSSIAVTQTIPGGTAVAAGHTDVAASGSGAVTLALGAISRSAGATLDVSYPIPGFAVNTSSVTTNGLLGTGPAFATVNNGATWATVGGAGGITIIGLPANSYANNTFSSSTANVDVTASSAQSGFTVNSLRFNAGSANLTLAGTNTLLSGGVLVTPNGGGMISGGILTSANGGELIFHVNQPFAANSALASSGGLTKTGYSPLTLSGTNIGLTGPIDINRGNLSVTTLAAINSASQIDFNDGSTFQQFALVTASGTVSPPIRLATYGPPGLGGFQFLNSGAPGTVITLGGALSSAPGMTTPMEFTTSNVGNGFNLTAANTFTGAVTLSRGSLGITADASLGDAGNSLFLLTNNLADGGLVFLNDGVTVARPVVITSPTRLVSNGADNNTISGVISGTGGIYKAGTGTLTLTNPGDTVTGQFIGGMVVNGGTLSLSTTGAVPSGTDVIVNTGSTFAPATAAGTSTYGTLTLNGGTLRVSAGTGQVYQVGQIVTKSLGGTVDFTGAGADQLSLTGTGGITVGANSTWPSPANGTTIANGTGAAIPISIPTGATLTNGIALAGTFGFRIGGGGTLFQNSDATNVLGMTAPIAVAQGQFRVTDVSSNGGVGNLGTGPFSLDGGTFSYGGATATTTKAMALTANGGTIQVESAAAGLTENGPIGGPGSLIKTGPGTLVLGNSGNAFSSLAINLGTVQVANDNVLGAGPVTIAAPATLQYTDSTTTARSFNLNFGTLAAAAGATVTLNAAAVNGGFLRGPGTFALTGGTTLAGVMTSASTVLSQTGQAAYTNVANGGPLTLAAGLAAPTNFTVFNNQGSGSITVGAADTLNVLDFQTYGTLTLTPAAVGSGQQTRLTNAGSSPLYFNGGSRTFVATPATAGQNLALVDLHGQNAVVAGGLFVNNGYVGDSTNSGATIIADFGSLVKGGGTFANSVVTQNGGKFQAGNSPGAASFGRFVFGPGGVDNYVFAIDDATGQAGPSPDSLGHVSGWSLVKAVSTSMPGLPAEPGDFAWTATPAAKLTVALETLLNPTTVGTDVVGPMDHFDPTRPYVWTAVEWAGAYSGPADAADLVAATAFDTGDFLNPTVGAFGWQLDAAGHSLSLTYTPTAVPEPGTIGLLGAATLPPLLCRLFRRRR